MLELFIVKMINDEEVMFYYYECYNNNLQGNIFFFKICFYGINVLLGLFFIFF